MGIIFLIVVIVIGAAIWWLAKGASSSHHGRAPGETPLDILKRRYAAGEITKEQFDGMKRDLEA
jgi:putative membrane protein